MSLSNVSRAKLSEDAPISLKLRTFEKAIIPSTEQELQIKLEALNQDIAVQSKKLEQDYQTFQEQLRKEREAFEVNLQEERNRTLEQGFSQGYEQGQQSGLEAWQGKLIQANQIIEIAKAQSEAYIQQSEPVILQLSLKIAEKIVGQTMDQSDEAWGSLVKEAVKEMREHSPIKVMVSANQYEPTCRLLDDLKVVTYGSDVLIFVDDSLKDLDCRIESPSGRLDAGVSTQISQLGKALYQLMGLSHEGY